MEQKFHSQQIKINLANFQVVSTQIQEDFGYCLNQLITSLFNSEEIEKVKKQVQARHKN